MTDETQTHAAPMDPGVDALVLDLCEWLARAPRSHADVMEAWRTSCPRLDVWETAQERRLVDRVSRDGVAMVELTEAGRARLAAAGRAGGAL